MNNIDPEAVILAEAVMKAAGSSLKHYMPRSQDEIIKACQDGINKAKQR